MATELGCSVCREEVYSGGPQPRFVVAVAGNALFHRCDVCATWWFDDGRTIRPITDAEATTIYTDVVDDGSSLPER